MSIKNVNKLITLLPAAMSWWTDEDKRKHKINPIGVIADFHAGWGGKRPVESWYKAQFDHTPYPDNDIALDLSEENKKWKFHTIT